MASNSGGKQRIDPEVEKFRLELNWSKIVDKLKTTRSSDYKGFLEGESQLELYLQQFPLIDNHHREPVEHNEEQLDRIENLLKPCQTFESFCLLSKLFYMRSNDGQSLNYVDKAFKSIPRNTAEQPNRSSLLLAEIYSLKGILIEKNNSNIEQIIECFENSCELSQKYYSAMEEAKHLSNENLDIENSLIEIAFQRLPLLYASNKNLDRAIERSRSFIKNLDIKSFETMRQTLIKQFAQLLIKCVCSSNYRPIDVSHDQSQRQRHKHRFAHQQHSESKFVPKNVDEEIALLLFLGQNCAMNEAVLDWQPEYEKQRDRSHQSAYHLLSLLAIFLSRKQAFHLIADSYEQALRFSFEHFPTWYNFGLSLISSGQPFRAYLILKECLRMQPKNIQVYLLLTKIILQDIYDLTSIFEQNFSSNDDFRFLSRFNRTENQSNNGENIFQSEERPPFLELVDEAIELSEKALSICEFPSPRLLVLLGLAKSFKARLTTIHQTRINLFQSSIDHFRQSIDLDPNDSIAYFHLSQNLAMINQIDDALKSIDQSLDLSPDDRDSLHLRSILLTSQKQYGQAYQQIYQATNQYEEISLLLTKASIEEELYGYDQSTLTCKQALKLWKRNFQSILSNKKERRVSSAKAANENQPTSNSMNFEVDGDPSTKSPSSSKNDETAKSSLLVQLRTLIGSGNCGDETSSSNPRSSTRSPSIATIHSQFVQIFDYLIRYTIELNQLDESEECLEVFSTIDSSSHQYHYLRGLIAVSRGKSQLAKQHFNDGLSLNPSHCSTLIQMTKLLIENGNYSLAEKYCRDAIAIQPSNHNAWYLLSLSMEARGEFQQAIDVAATAVQLEEDSPVVPFNSLVRVL